MMLYVARCQRAGFTLIEIMIVIAIIAILAGIVVPNVAMARFEAGITACQENCRIGYAAIQMAKVRHTWSEVANMLDSGYYGVDTSYEDCGGFLDSKFVEVGYLERPLKCSVSGSRYGFQYFFSLGAQSWDCFYKDWQCTQLIPENGVRYCVTYCCSSHRSIKGDDCYPC